MSERLRGRAGVAQRDRRLKRTNYLCEHCLEKGFVRLASEVDHKVALAFGGEDEDDNTQNLCGDCHAYKTAFEDASNQGGNNHPSWLRTSAVPLTIVCGPPCSGKTSYAEEHAGPGDLVIDLDRIIVAMMPGYQQWAGLDKTSLNKVIRTRNSLLGSLSRRSHGSAWFIVSAPTSEEREWWANQLGGKIILLNPGPDECKRRALSRGTPLATKGVDEWERLSRMRWQQPQALKKMQTIGEDGWPLG